MLTETPQEPPNNWANLHPKIPRTTIQENEEDPVAVSEKEEPELESDEYTQESEEDTEDDEAYNHQRQEKAKLVVADFLEQVKENKFGEFKWPPPPNCATYEHGMTSHYTKEFWFENESYTGEEYDTAKKFLRQVRESWDERLMKIYGKRISSYAQHAIKRINSHAKVENFQFVRTNKAVATTTTMLLLTLTIKETRSDAEKVIRVAVSSPFGSGPEILECNLVPSLSSS